jgi:hypothetical protein
MIPAEFWQQITREEWRGIVDNNGLDAVMCRKLWNLLDRTDRCPEFLDVRVRPTPGRA